MIKVYQCYKLSILICFLLFFTSGCDDRGYHMNDTEKKIVNSYIKNMNSICIGRFEVSVPHLLHPVSSYLTLNDAEITAYESSEGEFDSLIKKIIKELSQKNVVHEYDRPYLKKIYRLDNGIIIFDRNKNDYTPDAMRVYEGYKFDKNTYFKVKIEFIDQTADKYADDRNGPGGNLTNKESRFKEIKYILSKLHYRRSDDVPSGKGICLTNGFLEGAADDSIDGSEIKARDESLVVTYADINHPDINIQFYIDSSITSSDTLLDRISEGESSLQDDNNFKVLRKGKVSLKDIDQAEEWLATLTTSDDVKGNNFILEANSQRGTAFMPLIRISFRNGDRDSTDINRPNLDRASLTDAEAIAIWDAITRTFKPRVDAF